jgi:small subunit ribosomal protein S16
MLAIRLSRHGRSKRPFYRVVLTEHTKPAKTGYKEVLGSYDPLKHEFSANMEAVKSWIEQGAQPSERVAKLLFKSTNDTFYKKFYKEIERKGLTKNEKKE